jgi:hypothetical protein
MPNWCYNTANFRNEDTTKVDALEKFLEKNENEDKEESLLSYFLPRPESEKDNWYTWNTTNWGCKWDASVQSYSRISDEEITVTFETPWAPPIALYQYLSSDAEDWYATAYYLEEGCAFIGYVDDGSDEFYEYSDVASLDSIPDHIVDFWNLREQLQEREDDEIFDEEGVELTLDPEFDENLQKLGEELDAIPIPTENTLAFDSKKSKNWLISLLKDSAVTIVFLKKDGSERKLYCTLSESKIPAEKTPKGTEKSKSEEVLPVYDLENSGWRSFRWDSVKKIEFNIAKD